MTSTEQTQSYIILDGNATANAIKIEIAAEVAGIKAKGGKTPHLAAILVGYDGASETYVASKVKDCEKVGFNSSLFRFENDVTEEILLNKIIEINNNNDIDGLIVQLPLPKHISVQKVTETIDPKKDVDGFHPTNVGRMNKSLPAYVAATPYGIMQLLKRYNINTVGKHCVVIGRSDIVGTPMSILMSRNTNPGNCTVTLCHSQTENIAEIAKTADILILALGKPEFLKADMVKKGTVVVDVGITRIDAPETKNGYKLKGDVCFDEVAPLCSFITPVPGGVGPMTRVALLQNTLKSAKKEIYS
jgi:methylenetetrahydrofolate dehydrogenase (NADP+)/methenyltetrahydrofolate cyclohydrolase